MYRSVMDYNYMEQRTKRYDILGGAEGMIGGGGGFMMVRELPQYFAL